MHSSCAAQGACFESFRVGYCSDLARFQWFRKSMSQGDRAPMLPPESTTFGGRLTSWLGSIQTQAVSNGIGAQSNEAGCGLDGMVGGPRQHWGGLHQGWGGTRIDAVSASALEACKIMEWCSGDVRKAGQVHAFRATTLAQRVLPPISVAPIARLIPRSGPKSPERCWIVDKKLRHVRGTRSKSPMGPKAPKPGGNRAYTGRDNPEFGRR